MAVAPFTLAFTDTAFALTGVRSGPAPEVARFVTVGGGAGSGEGSGAGSGTGVGAAVVSVVGGAEVVLVALVLLDGEGTGSSLLAASAASNPPAAKISAIPKAATHTGFRLQPLPRSTGISQPLP